VVIRGGVFIFNIRLNPPHAGVLYFDGLITMMLVRRT